MTVALSSTAIGALMGAAFGLGAVAGWCARTAVRRLCRWLRERRHPWQCTSGVLWRGPLPRPGERCIASPLRRIEGPR